MAKSTLFLALFCAALLATWALPAPQDEAAEAAETTAAEEPTTVAAEDPTTAAAEDATTVAEATEGAATTAAPGGSQLNCEAYTQQCSSNSNNVPSQDVVNQPMNQTGMNPPAPVPTDQLPQNATSICSNPQMIQMCGQGNNLGDPTSLLQQNQNMTSNLPQPNNPSMPQMGNMTNNMPAPPTIPPIMG